LDLCQPIMLFASTLLSCIVASNAASAKLDWEDCGDASTHVVITDLNPTELPLGATTTVTGSGILDETQDGGSFKFKATLAGVPVTTGSGDLCKGADLTLPLGVGKITIKPLACPIQAGDAAVVLDITLAALLEDVNSLVKVDLTAATSSGDKLFCMKLNVDTPKQLTGVDCSAAECPSQCECSNDKCATELDNCLSDAACAKVQDCALSCACSDNSCILKCAAASPSVKALPAATCINKQCGSALETADVEPSKFLGCAVDSCWPDSHEAMQVLRVASTDVCCDTCVGNPLCAGWIWKNDLCHLKKNADYVRTGCVPDGQCSPCGLPVRAVV